MGDRISPEAAEAVALLFREEAAGLFRYACTLPGVHRADADDLVQATFQAAAVNWAQGLCSLSHEQRRGWLYRVLHNKAIDQWRTCGSRQVPSEQVEETTKPRQDTYLHAMWSIVLERCWDRISRMPEARQRVAFLKWRMDWSTAEIADLLGISKSTVRAHVKDARDALAEEIGPDVHFDDPDDGTREEGLR